MKARLGVVCAAVLVPLLVFGLAVSVGVVGAQISGGDSWTFTFTLDREGWECMQCYVASYWDGSFGNPAGSLHDERNDETWFSPAFYMGGPGSTTIVLEHYGSHVNVPYLLYLYTADYVLVREHATMYSGAAGTWLTKSRVVSNVEPGWYRWRVGFGQTVNIDNVTISWESDNMPTPTPSPTPTATPYAHGSQYGVECVYTHPYTEGVPYVETIPASIVTNGSFESTGASVPSGWESWLGTFRDHMVGGLWDGMQDDGSHRYSMDGSWSVKPGWPLRDGGYLVQPIYIPAGNYRVEAGASVIPGTVPEGGERTAYVVRDLRSVATKKVQVPYGEGAWVDDEWTHLTGSWSSRGGGLWFGIGVNAGPDEGAVFFDAVYAYLYERGEDGGWDIVCPGGDFLTPPDGFEFEDPGTGSLTGGPGFNELEFDTGVDFVRGDPDCIGWEGGELNMSDTTLVSFPGIGVCITPVVMTVTTSFPLLNYVDVLDILGIMFTVTMGFMIVRWVRGSR